MTNGTKYKFVETIGCTAFGFFVNEKDISELSENEYNEMLDYIFLKVKEGLEQNAILFNDVIKLFQYDDYEHDPHICGQCGDSVSTITWNI